MTTIVVTRVSCPEQNEESDAGCSCEANYNSGKAQVATGCRKRNLEGEVQQKQNLPDKNQCQRANQE